MRTMAANAPEPPTPPPDWSRRGAGGTLAPMTGYRELAGPGHAHSARLCLQRPGAEDADAHHELHSDPDTNVHNPAGPTTDRAMNATELSGWIAEWDEHGLGYWMVRLSCDGGVVGVAGVRRTVVTGVKVFNLAYRFRPSSWGNGYAGEAAAAAVEAAARAEPSRQVAALIRPTNTASIRVAERAGLFYVRDIDKDGRPTALYMSLPLLWHNAPTVA